MAQPKIEITNNYFPTGKSWMRAIAAWRVAHGEGSIAEADKFSDETLLNLSDMYKTNANGGKLYPVGLKIYKVNVDITGAMIVSISSRQARNHILIERFENNANVHALHSSSYPEGRSIPSSEYLQRCEDNWTASASVTATHDSGISKEGVKSVRLDVADGFTTGLIAYGYVGNEGMDLSGYHGLGFWIRSSTALNTGDLSIGISEVLEGTGMASNQVINQSIAADEWVWVETTFTGTVGSRTAIQSVTLTANRDFGEATIWLDGIRAKKLTDKPDSRINDIILNTGVESTVKYEGCSITLFVEYETVWSADHIEK